MSYLRLRNLGILQRTDGKEKDKIEVFLNTIEKWNNRMSSSRLFPSQNLKATLSKVSRSILYPLPALTLTETNCVMISNKLYSKCLPKCGVSSKFPNDFRYLPHQYQGLGLPDMYFEQESNKLAELVFKSYSESICWKQLNLGLEIAQSIVGTYDLVLNANYSQLNHLLPDTWIKSLWKFLFDQKLQIRGWKAKIQAKRQYDPSIMDVFVQKGVSKGTLTILNKCRRYIDATSLSDICTGDGKNLSKLSVEGKQRLMHITSYSTHTSKKTTVRDLQIWKQFVRACFCMGSITNRLTKQLGHWKSNTFDSFIWYFDPQDKSLLKKLSPTTFRRYTSNEKRRLSQRNNRKWYQVRDVISLCLHDSEALFDGAAAFMIQPPPNLPKTLYQQLIHDKSPKWLYEYVPTIVQSIADEYIIDMMDNRLRIASDGSYKTQDMGAATIIETQDGSKRIVLPMPVPDNSTHHQKADSYRAEAVGVLAAFHIVYAMERMSGKQTNIELACDNDRVLEVARSFTYVTPRMHHHDVLRSMMETRDSLTSTIAYTRVKAHKSEKIPYNKLSKIEQMNTECDTLAKLARTSLPKPTELDNTFKNEGLTVWNEQHDKLTTNLHENLHNHYFRNKAQCIFKKIWMDTTPI